MKLIILLTFFSCLFVKQARSQIQAEESNQLVVDGLAPEIRLPDPAGDTIALTDLRGKMVLIDFWATWCKPCLLEQPKLKTLYNKFKQATFTNATGFEIYGVSLDSKKTEWTRVIKKLKLSWIHVSDLKFWNSKAAIRYDIIEIPFNVLIDGEGNIIALNLHDADLDEAISQYIKK